MDSRSIRPNKATISIDTMLTLTVTLTNTTVTLRVNRALEQYTHELKHSFYRKQVCFVLTSLSVSLLQVLHSGKGLRCLETTCGSKTTPTKSSRGEISAKLQKNLKGYSQLRWKYISEFLRLRVWKNGLSKIDYLSVSLL